MKEVMELLRQIENIVKIFLQGIAGGKMDDKVAADEMESVALAVESLEAVVPTDIYGQYHDFFEVLTGFCRQCGSIDFLKENKKDFISSMGLLEECLEDLKNNYIRRDWLMIAFLKKEGLPEAREGMKVLQAAPAPAAVSLWIEENCPHIAYEAVDLHMENIAFRQDVMHLDTIGDETYDMIICSHVLEPERDDRKVLGEMKRILKPDGKIVFSVPVDLNASGIEELFFVHSLGKAYFGKEIFGQCALTDTGTLYVLTKSGQVSLNLAEGVAIDEELCQNGPLVSVILPCYNHEPFVAEAIESIIGQSYKNMEIIIGDDGSTDGTLSVIKKYASYFEKELYYENNTGGFKIWQQLWQMAKGKYIAVAHSDDVWEKDKIALQVAHMETHPECGACFTWCLYRDNEGKRLDNTTFIQPNRSSHEWMRHFWENGNALCNPSLLMRHEIHDKRKWHAGRQLPDFFSWVEIVQMSSVHIIPKVLVYMRSNEKCTSFPSEENVLRTLMETGCGWLWAIRNMDEAFFKKAFAPYLKNPNADTKEEIQCEKYFLMLSNPNPFMRYSAMCYYFDIFNDAEMCMEDKYHYTCNEFAKDMVENGIIR